MAKRQLDWYLYRSLWGYLGSSGLPSPWGLVDVSAQLSARYWQRVARPEISTGVNFSCKVGPTLLWRTENEREPTVFFIPMP